MTKCLKWSFNVAHLHCDIAHCIALADWHSWWIARVSVALSCIMSSCCYREATAEWVINARCLENNLYIYIFFPLHFWPSLAQYGRNVSEMRVNARCGAFNVKCRTVWSMQTCVFSLHCGLVICNRNWRSMKNGNEKWDKCSSINAMHFNGWFGSI